MHYSNCVMHDNYGTPSAGRKCEEVYHTGKSSARIYYSRFLVIVMGDMNGHVGILGEKVNENGRLIDFCEEKEFENLNVTIRNGLHTSESKEWKAAIDYVLVNHEARQHVREMYLDINEFDIDTDHRLLVLKYEWGGKEVMQAMSSVKEKWRLKAAN
ncbi:Endonuclease/exonuclease/phosphatase [Trinorchestia longiramus]|nr:Endonuclease/exonuclease/phosphatase [Trinorchestia longiramus]